MSNKKGTRIKRLIGFEYVIVTNKTFIDHINKFISHNLPCRQIYST